MASPPSHAAPRLRQGRQVQLHPARPQARWLHVAHPPRASRCHMLLFRQEIRAISAPCRAGICQGLSNPEPQTPHRAKEPGVAQQMLPPRRLCPRANEGCGRTPGQKQGWGAARSQLLRLLQPWPGEAPGCREDTAGSRSEGWWLYCWDQQVWPQPPCPGGLRLPPAQEPHLGMPSAGCPTRGPLPPTPASLSPGMCSYGPWSPPGGRAVLCLALLPVAPHPRPPGVRTASPRAGDVSAPKALLSH